MRRIDFRLDDDWWELAEVLARYDEISIHQLAYQCLIDNIRFWAAANDGVAIELVAVMDAQRQRDRQRQAFDNKNVNPT